MTGNILILDGDSQTLRVPFQADIRGTATAETIQVPAAGTVRFGGNAGDRVAFAGNAAAYTFSTAGNTLTVARDGGASATIALNGDTTLAFADGSTTATIGRGGDGVAIDVGGQTLGAGFDPATLSLDASDTSGIARPAPEVTLAGKTDSVTEGGAVTLTATAESDLIRDLDLSVAVRGTATDGTAAGSANDVALQPESLSFEAGDGDESGTSRTITVAAVADSRSESREAVTGALENAQGETLAETGVNIADAPANNLSISVEDSSDIFGGKEAALKASLEAAWEQWADELDLADGAVANIKVIGDEDVDDELLAQTRVGTSVTVRTTPSGKDVRQSGLVRELKTGIDPNGDSADVNIEIPRISDWAFNTQKDQPVPDGKFDGLTTFLHEIGHALGFNGTRESSLDYVTTYDRNVKEVTEGGGAVTTENLVFDGSAATNVNGSPVELLDDDAYHLANAEDLMSANLDPGESKGISDVDLAMLADAGAPISSVPNGDGLA